MKRRIITGILITLLLLAGCAKLPPGTPQPGSTEDDKTPPTESPEDQELVVQPIPEQAQKSRFGYMTQRTDPEMDKERKAWVALGVPWERAHPGYASWQEIEPSAGQYNWSFIDQYVNEAQASGAQILFTVWPFTDWDQPSYNLHLPQEPLLPPGALEKGKDPPQFSATGAAKR